jgi:hypothetical protein
VLGCPSCCNRIYVEQFGELVLFDEDEHLDVKPLPKENDR